MTSFEILSLIAASAAVKNTDKFDSFVRLALQKRISKEKIYEALLQNYLFCGFPNALFFLKRYHHLTGLKPKNYRTDFNKLKQKGLKTSEKIYGDKLSKLISNVKRFSPELSEWLIVEGYGKVISRPKLSIKEREACIISVLATQMFEEQLISHLYGGLKNGLKIRQIKKLISNIAEIGCETEKQFAIKVLEKVINKKT
ncbi:MULTISPECIES: carboxymuconolactone decarboxylase family protein [Ignavibacterium]|jgi:4-carboxymuconolactone decarboxylase|uniref:carboxymuconolactone decarboxylase family protein n=1 Tax=Ignavibacterium TaxID=795750 RepID=UPI0025B8F503|nr:MULTISPECIES: carboxymuconolactone decarboxylase family protein [Ignavibacterium]MBI5660870.1 carboxymuconolactone decarboxylase family protein [Ignavibacterium album]